MLCGYRLLSLTVLVACIGCNAPDNSNDGGNDAEASKTPTARRAVNDPKLVGTWKLLRHGKYRNRNRKDIRWIFSDATCTVRIEGDVLSKPKPYSSRSSSSPNQLDTFLGGESEPPRMGIYRIEDDVLFICYSDDDASRPTDFVEEDTMVFGRVKNGESSLTPGDYSSVLGEDLPDISSPVLGRLEPDSSGLTGYEGSVVVGDFNDVKLVLWPSEPIADSAKRAESKLLELRRLGPASLLRRELGALTELARNYGFAKKNTSREELLAGWDLKLVILSDEKIVLNFFGSKLYPSFDLRLSFDNEWQLTDIRFDG
jgi:uncharacterized protein (TIGR03067 family)